MACIYDDAFNRYAARLVFQYNRTRNLCPLANPNCILGLNSLDI